MGQPGVLIRTLDDESATQRLGAALAVSLPDPWERVLLLLHGELGAGKSTLARAVIAALGHHGPVPSPTYTLLEPYELARGPVYHLDLYRLADAAELEFIGWRDIGSAVVLVEWPERAPEIAQQADLRIEMTLQDSGRAVKLQALSEPGRAIITRLVALLPE